MTQPAGIASKTAVRTASGFLGHLRRYHHAKETDGVAKEPKNG